MVLELEITEDLLKVLPLINIMHNERELTKEVYNDEGNVTKEFRVQQILQIDSEQLLLGTDMIEDVAFALGIGQQNVADMNGTRMYDQWVYDKINGMCEYLRTNLYNIESLIHQFIGEKLEPGFYRARDNEMIWKKVQH